MLKNSAVKEAIEKNQTITILSHINPDADTLGTALGIYALLKEYTQSKIEVVNASSNLPPYLSFLPYFQKIKSVMEYHDSLIIACDGGNIHRFGFDISQREIINIDHHQSNTLFGTINIVEASYASASQVAFELFQNMYEIHRDVALCFYVALVSDSQYLTSPSVTNETFNMLNKLIQLGVEPAIVSYHLKEKKSLASVRILAKALTTLRLSHDARVATILISQDDIVASGAMSYDMEGIVDYAKSLSTVEIALCVIEMHNTIRVSLRSKKINIIPVAVAFGGGGHKLAAGFTLSQYTLQETKGIILDKIEKLGLIT